MPCSKTHGIAGTVAGTAASLYFARQQEPSALALEALGGALAGSWSGCWADHIEPAFHPHHRGPAHAAIPNALVWYPYFTQISNAQNALRHYSEQFSARAQESSGVLAVLYDILAALLRIGTGAVAGIPAGYLSHVALDAFTPFGIPVIGLRA